MFVMPNSESTQETGSKTHDSVKFNNASQTIVKSGNPMSQQLRRVPPFAGNRFLRTIPETQKSQPPSFIKQEYTIDLVKLPLNELNELLKKQTKLAQNKKLLSKLKDKGEKVISFCDKIAATIKLKTDIEDAQIMMDKLNLNCNHSNIEGSPKNHRIEILQKPASVTQPRLNMPQKLESTVSKLTSNNFKEVKVKIEISKEIKTLDLQESLQTLEMTNLKNKTAMTEHISQFETPRIPKMNIEYGDSQSECDDEFDDEENDEENEDALRLMGLSLSEDALPEDDADI